MLIEEVEALLIRIGAVALGALVGLFRFGISVGPIVLGLVGDGSRDVYVSVNHLADIFSLGKVLQELVVGETPVNADMPPGPLR